MKRQREWNQANRRVDFRRGEWNYSWHNPNLFADSGAGGKVQSDSKGRLTFVPPISGRSITIESATIRRTEPHTFELVLDGGEVTTLDLEVSEDILPGQEMGTGFRYQLSGMVGRYSLVLHGTRPRTW